MFKSITHFLFSLLSLIGGLTISSSLQSHINKATIWKIWNDKNNRYHYIITCADTHVTADQFKEIAKEQIACLKKSMMLSKNLLFVVEDMASYNLQNEHILNAVPKSDTYLEQPIYNYEGGILLGLANFIARHQKPVINAECRFVLNLLESPLFYAENIKSDYSDEIFKLAAEEILKTYKLVQKKHKTLLSSLSENFALLPYQEFYQGIYSILKENYENIKAVQLPTFSMKNYLLTEPPFICPTVMPLFRSLCSSLFRVLDISLMQTIITEQHNSKICIMMGESHIHNINLFLEKAGFEKIKEVGKYVSEQYYTNEFCFTDSIFPPYTELSSRASLIERACPIDPVFFEYLNEDLST